jgi:hypothetical protein
MNRLKAAGRRCQPMRGRASRPALARYFGAFSMRST